MNFKKIFTIMIVLFIALGVSAVNASEDGADSAAMDEIGSSGQCNQAIADNSNDDGDGSTALQSTEIVADDAVYKITNEKKYNVTLLSNGTPLAGENITFIINGTEESNSTTNDKGIATLDVSFLKVGVYDISAIFGGTDKYGASAAQSTIKVFTTIAADDVVKYFKNGTQFEASFYNSTGDPIVNKTVTIEINKAKYYRNTSAEGSIVFSINLAPGNYTIKVTNPVTKDTLTRFVTVLPVVYGENIELYFKNGTQYVATFVDGEGNPLNGASVQFNINGVKYDRITSNGTAALAINLPCGKYTVTASNLENGAANSNEINVLSTILGENVNLYWKNGTAYSATFLDGQGNPLNDTSVQFNINGVKYNKVTANGTAALTINLPPGKYTITATNPANGQMYSNEIQVLSIIDAKDYSKTWNTSGGFSFKTLDNQGNALANQSVDLNINGVIYHKTTDENGSGFLNINLIPGSYVCTVYYNGLAQGYKITINKITPTVAIISSTVKKGENYQCKVSYNGNPISNLRVYYIINPSASDQQVFAYRTNSEGIASAPIQLPVGKYQFAIGIQDETFYANAFVQTTLNVVE